MVVVLVEVVVMVVVVVVMVVVVDFTPPSVILASPAAPSACSMKSLNMPTTLLGLGPHVKWCKNG